MQYITFRLQTDCNQTFHPHLFPLNTFYTSYTSNNQFIIATDNGIFHKMKKLAGDKQLIEAPTAGVGATCESCAHCPWMAMNSLHNLASVLETMSNEITIDEAIRKKAVLPLTKMMSFGQEPIDSKKH